MARPEALLFFMFQILNLTPTLSTLFSLLAPFGKCLFIFDTSGRHRPTCKSNTLTPSLSIAISYSTAVYTMATWWVMYYFSLEDRGTPEALDFFRISFCPTTLSPLFFIFDC